jgi:hypothetical protein
MNRISKSLAVAAIALGAVGVASAAHARSDVVLSIGVNAPYGYVQPAPVYERARPVYEQPQVVYYGEDSYRNDSHRDQWRHEQWRREEMRRAELRRHHGWDRRGWADYDHDGVPNRFDRAPANPHRY